MDILGVRQQSLPRRASDPMCAPVIARPSCLARRALELATVKEDPKNQRHEALKITGKVELAVKPTRENGHFLG